jgi:hypothetical protein
MAAQGSVSALIVDLLQLHHVEPGDNRRGTDDPLGVRTVGGNPAQQRMQLPDVVIVVLAVVPQEADLVVAQAELLAKLTPDVYITGCGAYLPGDPVDNVEMAAPARGAVRLGRNVDN